MGCVLDLPELQLAARGVAIDFLFVTEAPDGTLSTVDVTTAIEAQCFALFRKPGRPPLIVRTAILVASPGPNRMRYVVEDGFLDKAGEWTAQGFVMLAGSPTIFVPSEVVVFRVLHNLRPFSPVPTLTPEPATLPLVVPVPEVLP